MSENMLAEIQRMEWKIRDGVLVPYYVDREHQKLMEKIAPHDKLTFFFPYDTLFGAYCDSKFLRRFCST